MDDSQIFQLSFNIAVVVFSFGSFLFVYRKYQQRKLELLKILAELFFFYTIYLVFNTTQQWYSGNISLSIAQGMQASFTFTTGDPNFILWAILYTCDLALSTLTSIIALRFSLITFTGNVTSLFSRFRRILGWGTFALTCLITVSVYWFFYYWVNFFVTVFLFLVYVPFSFEAFATTRRMKEKGEGQKYIRAFFFIGLMALCFVLRQVFLIVDGIITGTQTGVLGSQSTHTVFNIVGWVFLIAAYIAAYFGYIWPSRKQEVTS